MNMLGTVIRVQWTILKRDRMLWALLALFAGLLLYAGISGLQDAQARQAAIEAAQAAESERLQELENSEQFTGDPYETGHVSARRVAVLPPGPLALLTRSGDAVSHLEITLASQLSNPEEQSRPVSLGRISLGTMDMVFVLLYLLPLLIIALTYDLLLGEREQKTLAMVLSHPVSATTFMLGKLLARAALIAVATLVPVIGLWGYGASAGAGFAIGLGALALVSYIAFWLAAAVAANAWMKSSASSALALMGLWLAALVLVPGLIRIGVETLYPPPSRVELVNLSRQAAQEAENALKAMEGNHGQEANAGANQESYQEFLKRKVEAHEHMDHALHHVLESFDKQLAKQQAMVQWLQFLSPAVVMREGFSELSGDSVYRQQRFKAQAGEFHDGWKDYFFARIKAGESLSVKDIESLPAFEYEAEPRTDLVVRVLLGLVGIWLPTGLLFLVGLRRVRQPTGRL